MGEGGRRDIPFLSEDEASCLAIFAFKFQKRGGAKRTERRGGGAAIHGAGALGRQRQGQQQNPEQPAEVGRGGGRGKVALGPA